MSSEIRQKFLDFFKKRGHAVVPSSSLIPDDPSVLLTTAGMQQFKRYFTGELDAQKDFGSKNAASAQKCFRTSDIDEVGDKTHLTFFEMLGNFSFEGYFKREAIKMAYEFVTEVLEISPERIYVSVFHGDKDVPKDKESYDIWHKEIGLPEDKIKLSGREDNFWGPTGNEGPCGRTTEIYVDGVEVWNIVFNEYYCSPASSLRGAPATKQSQEIAAPAESDSGTRNDKMLTPLKTPGVDTGMGLERLLAILSGADNVFETDLFHPLITKIYEIAPGLPERIARVLADHLRASIFLIGDGVRPSNKEAGYILRRLLRRVLAYEIQHDVHGDLFTAAMEHVKKTYGDVYPEIKKEKEILEVMRQEKEKYQKTLTKGLTELKKYEKLSPSDAFYLYETFGLHFELIKEFAPEAAKAITKNDFEREFKKHQEISRAGADKKFGGEGLYFNNGEIKAANEEELKKCTRLHTATHLVHRALREVLGDQVRQMGSAITAAGHRFDFTFPRKLTAEELKKVEDIVNEVIAKDLPMSFVELPQEEAEKTGALHFFKEKYPDPVKVYYVDHDLKTAFSKEFCRGPHVTHTGELGQYKILKEEAVGSGTRRLRATVEP